MAVNSVGGGGPLDRQVLPQGKSIRDDADFADVDGIM
jgi:hypothetical protein